MMRKATPPNKARQQQVTAAPVPPSRVGKVAIGGHFPPAISRHLRMIAAERDRTIQDLLAEALSDLFKKLGRPL
jgi:hypothetical protein